MLSQWTRRKLSKHAKKQKRDSSGRFLAASDGGADGVVGLAAPVAPARASPKEVASANGVPSAKGVKIGSSPKGTPAHRSNCVRVQSSSMPEKPRSRANKSMLEYSRHGKIDDENSHCFKDGSSIAPMEPSIGLKKQSKTPTMVAGSESISPKGKEIAVPKDSVCIYIDSSDSDVDDVPIVEKGSKKVQMNMQKTGPAKGSKVQITSAGSVGKKLEHLSALELHIAMAASQVKLKKLAAEVKKEKETKRKLESALKGASSVQKKFQ